MSTTREEFYADQSKREVSYASQAMIERLRREDEEFVRLRKEAKKKKKKVIEDESNVAPMDDGRNHYFG